MKTPGTGRKIPVGRPLPGPQLPPGSFGEEGMGGGSGSGVSRAYWRNRPELSSKPTAVWGSGPVAAPVTLRPAPVGSTPPAPGVRRPVGAAGPLCSRVKPGSLAGIPRGRAEAASDPAQRRWDSIRIQSPNPL